jgi:hypothetical protein
MALMIVWKEMGHLCGYVTHMHTPPIPPSPTPNSVDGKTSHK